MASDFLLVSTITRLGAILLLIFGVQILVSLYKYNIRLAAFLDAQADALEMVGTSDVQQLAQLIQVLSPNAIDFGKAPSHPTKELAEVIAQAVRSKK